MNARFLVLASAAFGVAAVGVGYLISPQTVLALYDVQIQSINEANIFRAGYGGLFLAFAILFGVGAGKPDYSREALLALGTFMAGFAFGRVISLMLDGTPALLLIGLLTVEVCYSAAAFYLLSNQDAHNNSLQGRRP